MKIAVIGASGKAGNFILTEALERGHEVTAIVRNANKITNKAATVIEKNIFELQSNDIDSFDVIVNAFNAVPGQEHQHVEAGKVLIEALKHAPHTKMIVVGGAGSIYVDEAKTLRVMDTPDFPAAYFPTAFNMGKNYEELQQTSGIQWTYISPSAFFDPSGKRTGSYVKGKDQLLVNTKGDSYISYPDYAIAVLDEIEHPQHRNERFTVVGEAQ
ncbi:NAD(P)-dependent oxidoreductase [Paenibacillus sp. IITD108]|uniref:NAD(P)-dependent oxidoreductase n=1 Tax=Paenibacillus sp. IITD108 TaxID=3116649 RepID=UPI002F411FFB